MIRPKYARMERERRFLVQHEGWRKLVTGRSRAIDDLYLDGCRLRLRRLVDSDSGSVTLKLTKKYGSEVVGTEPIVTILLSTAEYGVLAALPGRRLMKTRHYDDTSGRMFGVDVFGGELAGLVMCSTEADSDEELRAVVPPDYASDEVTADSFFTGGHLCGVGRAALLTRLPHLR